MKKIAFGIACGLVCIFVVAMMLTLFGRDARQSETEYMLAQAMDVSLSAAVGEENGEAMANEEFVADFLQTLLIQANSDSDITVSVLDADAQKGILSVEITEKFKHPNGNEGSVSQARTVIFDKKKEKKAEYRCVSFYTDEDELYKEYRIPKDAACSVPTAPKKAGKRFLGWRFEKGGTGKAGSKRMTYPGGKMDVLTEKGMPYLVSEDTKLMAIFE